MRRKKNKKLLALLFIVLFVFISQTIVYSAISSTMTITGDAYARAVADVRITDFKLSSSSSNYTSYYEEFNVNTISTKFDLIDSSSSIVFDVEITNYGSADVGILQLVGTVPTGLSYEIINYNLKDKICDDTGKCNVMAVKTFQIKFTGAAGEYEVNLELDFRTYHKVTYTDINVDSSYPAEVIDGGDLNITFVEDLDCMQINTNSKKNNYYDISSGQTIMINKILDDVEIKKRTKVLRLVKGNLDTIGSEVCVNEQCFYIISSDGSTISMLAKYNLYVGGSYDGSTWTAYGDEATGIQNSSMLGLTSSKPYEGTTAFSTTTYWAGLLKGNSYAYDNNSILYNYVENYKTYLENTGAVINRARLISYEELVSLGCNESENSCSGAPSWIYSTSYWSGSNDDDNDVWTVDLNGRFDDYFTNKYHGTRPVITISKKEIKEHILFTIDGDTYHAEDGMTWSEWVDSEYNTDGFRITSDIVYSDSKFICNLNVSNAIPNNSSYNSQNTRCSPKPI